MINTWSIKSCMGKKTHLRCEIVHMDLNVTEKENFINRSTELQPMLKKLPLA